MTIDRVRRLAAAAFVTTVAADLANAQRAPASAAFADGRGSMSVADLFAWLAKSALGKMQRTVSVNGYLATNDYNDYGAVQTELGGCFALPSNIGHYSRPVRRRAGGGAFDWLT